MCVEHTTLIMCCAAANVLVPTQSSVEAQAQLPKKRKATDNAQLTTAKKTRGGKGRKADCELEDSGHLNAEKERIAEYRERNTPKAFVSGVVVITYACTDTVCRI